MSLQTRALTNTNTTQHTLAFSTSCSRTPAMPPVRANLPTRASCFDALLSVHAADATRNPTLQQVPGHVSGLGGSTKRHYRLLVCMSKRTHLALQTQRTGASLASWGTGKHRLGQRTGTPVWLQAAFSAASTRTVSACVRARCVFEAVA
jgi:hypothetical protein